MNDFWVEFGALRFDPSGVGAARFGFPWVAPTAIHIHPFQGCAGLRDATFCNAVLSHADF
jgi:hypothetical protein